jgi:uncharacterized protein (DUF427 family)
MRAVWNDVVIAESDHTVIVEGNHYFPRASLAGEHFEDSSRHTTCAWKGEASYFDVVVNGQRNEGAAWYYPDPKPAADDISGRVAFWKGVTVEASPGT